MTYGSLVNGPQDCAWSLSLAAMSFILNIDPLRIFFELYIVPKIA